MVAIMNEALELGRGQKVLEVGAGSGYHSATIAEVVKPDGHVYTVEIVEDLVKFAKHNLDQAGYADLVTLVHADGSLGYADRAPYDRVSVTAAAPDVPSRLLEQLKDGGVMVVPVGGRVYPQELLRVRKDSQGRTSREYLGSVAFVPLLGEHGFKE